MIISFPDLGFHVLLILRLQINSTGIPVTKFTTSAQRNSSGAKSSRRQGDIQEILLIEMFQDGSIIKWLAKCVLE